MPENDNPEAIPDKMRAIIGDAAGCASVYTSR